MQLPFKLNVPAFRQEVLDNASEVIFRETKNWIDILAIRGKDKVYIGTIKNIP